MPFMFVLAGRDMRATQCGPAAQSLRHPFRTRCGCVPYHRRMSKPPSKRGTGRGNAQRHLLVGETEILLGKCLAFTNRRLLNFVQDG